MKLAARRIAAGSRQRLDRDESAVAALASGLLVVDIGEGAALAVPHKFAGLWSPVAGRVQASSADGELALRGECLFASDSERALEIATSAGARCIGVIAQQRTWARLASITSGRIAPEPAVFPALHDVPPALGASFASLAGAIGSGAATVWPAARIAWLAHALHDLQAPYDELVARCRGRSLAHRKQTFLRLQRVRHCISTHTDGELDIARLARMASYSNWHLIRSFGAVFGETPYAHFMGRRIERARSMIETGTLGVGDVAMATGFDSQSSLTRAIKRRLGVSSVELRRRPHAAAMQALASTACGDVEVAE
ncbi:MAG: helix-turn-helix transcriptional regulator [Mizugakiibacter sp.]|uniref:helix-turn-helix transcriptional regulator n=1 Tax=Mizugakiibacter sp. TaxID=1972610 RepID=UPI00320D7874